MVGLGTLSPRRLTLVSLPSMMRKSLMTPDRNSGDQGDERPRLKEIT